MLAVVEGHGMHRTNDAFVIVVALLTLVVLMILTLIFFTSFWLLSSKRDCPTEHNRRRHHRFELAVFLVVWSLDKHSCWLDLS